MSKILSQINFDIWRIPTVGFLSICIWIFPMVSYCTKSLLNNTWYIVSNSNLGNFHQKSSSITGSLSSKVLFHLRLCSIKVCPPSKIVFHRRYKFDNLTGGKYQCSVGGVDKFLDGEKHVLLGGTPHILWWWGNNMVGDTAQHWFIFYFSFFPVVVYFSQRRNARIKKLI